MNPISHPAAYDAALRELEILWNATPGSPEEARGEDLAAAIAAYEAEAYPSVPYTPRDVVEFHLEARGPEGRKQLIAILGGAPRVSEVLSGKRGLTDKMKIALHKEWGIPYEMLLEGSGDAPTVTFANTEETSGIRLLRDELSAQGLELEGIKALLQTLVADTKPDPPSPQKTRRGQSSKPALRA